jgi:flagellar basal-body rod modification protein FlgD
MSTTSPTSSTTSGSSAASAANTGLSDRMQSLSVDDFTKMLVAELQNQDPSQPMSNTDLMNQVSQIRSIDANTQLTTTLQSVALGQSISSAGNLIGRNVSGLDGKGNKVSGTVSSASISGNDAILNIGNSTINLNNVTEISPAKSSG